MLTVFCTAPHSRCIPNAKKRMCDSAAKLASEFFYETAQEYKNLDCLYFPGTEYRFNYDLNRKSSRSTNYRRNLEQAMRQIKTRSDSCIIADIHSFPNYYMEEAGDINFFKKDEIAPDVVILQGPLDNYQGKSLSDIIFKTLHAFGVKVKVLHGIAVNDVMNHGSEYEIPGLLIEINEKFNESPEELMTICQIIVKALATLE